MFEFGGVRLSSSPSRFKAFDGDVEQRVGGLVGPHHGHVGAGPGEDEARIEGFAAQGVIARPVRAAGDDRDLRHAAVADGVDQLGAGLDDARAFGVAADHKAVDVLQENDRQPVLIAIHHEPGGLFGAVDVQHAAELIGPVGRPHAMMLIGDDADGKAADPRRAADE